MINWWILLITTPLATMFGFIMCALFKVSKDLGEE